MTQFVAWLWQGAVLALIVDVLLRGMPRLNAATRHACWWGALAGVAVLGVIHGAAAVAAVPGLSATLTAPSSPVTAAVTLPEIPSWFITLALGVWVVSAAFRVSRVIVALRRVTALRAEARIIAPADSAQLRHWSRPRASRRPAPLCLTSSPVGACALGFRRPVILVSQHLWDTLDHEALDHVVLHEQAHLDRFDDWLRLAQSIVTAVVGIHPAVHIIGRRIDLEREAACDDRVVSVTGTAGAYASDLTRVAAVAARRVLSIAPAVLGTPTASLRARIVRLLDPRRDRSRRLAWGAALPVTAVLAAAGAVALCVEPVVVFASAQAVTPTASAVPAVAASGMPMTPLAASDGTGLDRASARPAGAPDRVQVSAASSAPVSRGQNGLRVPPKNSPSPSLDVPIATLSDVPPEGIGQVTVTDTVPPEPRKVEDLAPTSPGQPGAGASLASDVSQLGRNTATTARKMGLSVAGALTRAGKAIGKSF